MTSDDALGVPAFGRIEIALPDREAIGDAATALADLAGQIGEIAANPHHDQDTARLLAYRHMRATSAKLRGKK